MSSICNPGDPLVPSKVHVMRGAEFDNAGQLSVTYTRRVGLNFIINTVTLGLVIGIQCSRNVLAQVQNAFDNKFYITPFGNAPGQLVLTILHGENCYGGDEDNEVKEMDPKTFYELLRFHGGSPLLINVGGHYTGDAISYSLEEQENAQQMGRGMKTSTLTFILLETA